MDTKDNITKTMKLRSLQCFSEVIPDHVQSGTELHTCFMIRDFITDEIISNIDVASPLVT